jgi:PAS domain S-box-containing protein
MSSYSQNLLKLIDAIPDLIFYRDREGYYQACNQAYAEFIGRPVSKIVGRHSSTIQDPQKSRHFLSLDQKVIRENQPLQQIMSLRHANGETLLYNVFRSPLRSSDGEVLGVAVIAHDITEEEALRKKAEEENFKYLASLEANPDPMVVYNMAGEVDYINPAFTKTFGWSFEECRGRKMDFVPDDCWPETLEMIAMVKRGESFRNVESRRYTRDGRTITVSISGAMFRGQDGVLQGSIITLRDITRQKELENQLNQSRKLEALGNLAGGIAHDFNNLLTAIRGHISIIQMKSEGLEQTRKRFSQIEEIINQGANLTRQLLGFAQGGKYQVEVLNLNRVINESLELFVRTLKELTISTRLAEDLANIEADRGQIDQVLLNLYLNARQAMRNTPGTARLEIETCNCTVTSREHPRQKPGRYVRVSVIDNGCGMDEETRKHIFEPFFSTKADQHGKGLGLSSAYGIINNHGGFITVASRPGEGSAFHVFLPAVDKQPTDSPDSPDPRDELVNGSATVLLVDDEEMVREVNQEILGVLGYRVRAAASGPEALAIYREKGSEIDLVILDMIMPDMNGTEVFKKLKEINPEVRVLLASGYSADGEAAEIVGQGSTGFIQKPFTIKKLSDRINEILQG